MDNKNQITKKIDWNFLRKGRGARKVITALEIIIGRVLLVISLTVVFFVFFSSVLNNFAIADLVFARDKKSWIFFLSSIGIIYSFYLLRNREDFYQELNLKDLSKIRKNSVVSIEKFLNYKVLFDVDFVLNLSKQEDFLFVFFSKIAQHKESGLIFSRLGINFSDFDRSILDEICKTRKKVEILTEILSLSFDFALKNNFKDISPIAVMYVMIMKYYDNYLCKFNITHEDLIGIAVWISNEELEKSYRRKWAKLNLKPSRGVNRAYTSRATPTLDLFGRDFTQEVLKGDFDYSISREDEINNLMNLVEKGEKSAVLIIGEPGIGKTTLIKSLAVKMVVEEAPAKLIDMRLVGFDFNRAFTYSKTVENFQKILKIVFDEVAISKHVILVLDNINQLLNLRQEISGEIANIIYDSYDKQNLRLIATTDRMQYTRFIRPNTAISSIFSTIEMRNPPKEVMVQIVADGAKKIEKEYGVQIAFSAIKASVYLSEKFPYDRVLPDKALDILREAVARFKSYKDKKPIQYEEIAEVISQKVGVKLGKIEEDESKRLANLENIMHKRVVGQDEAIIAVSKALRRSRSGLASAGRPIASFLFFGPTGVGKTEVAKTVAEVYYGNEQRIVRIDMNEYNEEQNIVRLIGQISERGSFEGGTLTEQVHHNPFSVVLLDELEKANAKVFDLFLQILDEGYIIDGAGRKIDFENTIIIATSNAGSDVIASLLEQGFSYQDVYDNAFVELRKIFKIEFLNRFDRIIMFKPLSREEVKIIAKKFVEQLRVRLLEKGIVLNYSDKLLDYLAKKGYNVVYGAREMRRVVQEEVEDKIAEMIINNQVAPGGIINL